MAKIVFIQNLWVESLIGIMQLSAVVKQRGHEAELLMDEGNEDRLLRTLAAMRPDLVGFSFMTGQRLWALERAAAVKRALGGSCRVICGGVHPTFDPEIIEDANVDIVCRGEGEYALLELMDLIDRGGDYSAVRNLWVKTGDGIVKNPLRPKIENLDELPFIDRELLYRYGYFRDAPVKSIIVSRGCPFKCSYCFNGKYWEIYGERDVRVRWRDYRKVIEELKELKARYPETRAIYFQDDNFILNNREWLVNLLTLYKDEIGLPFTANIRSGTESEEIIRLMAEAGCWYLSFGLETGSEELRNGLLNKKVTDDSIFATVRLLRRYGIRICTNNMFFLPGSDGETLWKTIRMNQAIAPSYSSNSIFQPFPGTAINEHMIERGLIDRDFLDRITSIYSLSSYNSPNKREEVNVFYLSYLLIHFPKLTPLLRLLSKIGWNGLFWPVYKISAGLNQWTKNRFTLSRFLREAAHHYNFR